MVAGVNHRFSTKSLHTVYITKKNSTTLGTAIETGIILISICKLVINAVYVYKIKFLNYDMKMKCA